MVKKAVLPKCIFLDRRHYCTTQVWSLSLS